MTEDKLDTAVLLKDQTGVDDAHDVSNSAGYLADGLKGRRFTELDGIDGLTPGRLARVMRATARDGDFAEQSEVFKFFEQNDGHIAAEMSKRRRAILTLDWFVKPKSSDARAVNVAAQAQEWLSNITDFEDVLLDLMDGVGQGFSAVQLQWLQDAGTWHIGSARFEPQGSFKLRPGAPVAAQRNDVWLKNTAVNAGVEPLWAYKWAVHIHRARSGYLTQAGLYRTLAWPYIFKHFATRDFAEFLEVYGQPMKVGTFPRTSTPKEKNDYLRSLLALGHNAAGVFPEGMSVDLKNAVSGQPDAFLKMLEYMDRVISKAVLGQTLTSGGDGGGSYALGQVHRDVQLDILKSDAKQLAGTITRDFVAPMLMVNGLIDKLSDCPVFSFDIQDTEDLQGLAQALPNLVKLGTQVPERWVRSKFRIPERQNNEPVLTATEGKPLQNALSSKLFSLKQNNDAGDLTPDLTADVLASNALPAIDDMVNNIRDVVNAATSLQDLQNTLLTMYATANERDLANVMDAGFALAHLRGLDNVRTELGVNND